MKISGEHNQPPKKNKCCKKHNCVIFFAFIILTLKTNV